MSDENFIVQLSSDTFFVDVHNGNQICTSADRDKAARLTERMANDYMRRLRMRGWRQASVVPAEGEAAGAASEEARRIAAFWSNGQ